MSKSKEERKREKATAREAKRRNKDERAATTAAQSAGEKAAKRAYEYMVVGGIALFFQAVILCSTGYIWSGGFLFPLAVLCWVKSRSRAFSTCLAIVGFAISIFELCDCAYALILLFTYHHEPTYASQWVASIVLETLGALLAILAICVFPLAILRLSQATFVTSIDPEPIPPIRQAEETTPSPRVKSPPQTYTRTEEPMNGRHELHAAQLITNPYAQPQPILIAGPPPPPGQPGLLQPAGYAYIAYPPNAQRNAIPMQPLTGQPILAGQPVIYPPYPQAPPVHHQHPPYHSPPQHPSPYGPQHLQHPPQTSPAGNIPPAQLDHAYHPINDISSPPVNARQDL